MRKFLYTFIALTLTLNCWGQMLSKATSYNDLEEYEVCLYDANAKDPFYIVNDGRAYTNLTYGEPIYFNIYEWGNGSDGKIAMNADIINCCYYPIVKVIVNGMFNDNPFTTTYKCNIKGLPNDTDDKIECFGTLKSENKVGSNSNTDIDIKSIMVFFSDGTMIDFSESRLEDVLTWDTEEEWKHSKFNPLLPIF